MGNPSQADRSRDISELQQLGVEVQSATDLERVKQIFYRVQGILQTYPGDSEVQNAGTELKQLALIKGKRIQEAIASGITPPTPPSSSPGSYVVDPLSDIGQPPMSTPPPFAVTPPPVQDANGMTTPMATPFPPSAAIPLPMQTNMQPVQERSNTPIPIPDFAPPVQAPPPPPPPPKVKKKMSWGIPVLLGTLLAFVLAAAVIGISLHNNPTPKPPSPAPAVTSGKVEVHTTPPGASISLNGEVRAQSDSDIDAKPGTYMLEAKLDGFEPASTSVTVQAGKSVPVTLSLTPSGQSVQLLTDLDTGTVSLDGQEAKPLGSGAAVIDHVAPGEHKIAVKGPRGDASFSFTVAQNSLAVVQPQIGVRNLLAILISSNGSSAKVLSSSRTPVKIAIDGKERGAVTPQGLDVDGLTPGDHELVWEDSPTPRKLVIHVSPAPALAAYLKLDINAGTLIIASSEDKAKVFIDGKEYHTPIKGGTLRIPGLAVKTYAIRVARDGFATEPEQQVKIRKGEETRVEFKLHATPKLAGLTIHGAKPGTAVLLDGETLGQVGADGSFSSSAVNLGDHIVELRRDQFSPRKLQKRFEAGKTIELSGNEVTLQQLLGRLNLAVSPSSSVVSVQGPGEAQPHVVRDTALTLSEGSYTFTAEAPGFHRKSVTVQVASGQTKAVDLSLTAEKAAAPAAAGMADWLDAKGWTDNGEWLVHRGGNFVLYRITPSAGIYTFSATLLKSTGVFKTRPLQWVLNFQDPKNYVLIQMDKKYFTRKVVVDGNTRQLAHVPHGLDEQTSYTVRIDVTPETITHRIRRNGSFAELDTWTDATQNFGKGRFGFFIPGQDEVGLKGFSFQPNK